MKFYFSWIFSDSMWNEISVEIYRASCFAEVQLNIKDLHMNMYIYPLNYFAIFKDKIVYNNSYTHIFESIHTKNQWVVWTNQNLVSRLKRWKLTAAFICRFTTVNLSIRSIENVMWEKQSPKMTKIFPSFQIKKWVYIWWEGIALKKTSPKIIKNFCLILKPSSTSDCYVKADQEYNFNLII